MQLSTLPLPIHAQVWGDGFQVKFTDGERIRLTPQQIIYLARLARDHELTSVTRQALTRSHRRLMKQGLIDVRGRLTGRGHSLVGWLAQTRRRDLRALSRLIRPN